MWVINVYIHDGEIQKIQKMFGKIQKEIPQNEWDITILMGDFNVNADEKVKEFCLLKSICKSMVLCVDNRGKDP